MQLLRAPVRKLLGTIDAWYYRRYRLHALGPVLYLGRDNYRGPDLHFEDGTSLRDNEPIGRLHFNNASIAALGEGSLHQTGLRFARVMRLSLLRLAECAHSNPEFQDIRVFQGVTWIPEHGKGVGFVSKPLPNGVRTLLLSAHFRLLLWAFAPAEKTRQRTRQRTGQRTGRRTGETGGAEPRVYWLTRTALQRNLGKLARVATPE